MNNERSSPSRQPAEPSFATAPFTVPTAQMLPGSTSMNVHGVIQNDRYFATALRVSEDNDNEIFRYDKAWPGFDDLPQNIHQSQGNGQHQQFDSNWTLSREHQRLEPVAPQYLETNVAFGTSGDVFEEYGYHPAEPALPNFYQSSTPSTERLENSRAVDTIEAADALNDSLIDKEKQARAVLKKQRSQDSVSRQMGESVSIDQTATGIHFHGVYWTAPANDDTIPSTTAEINAHIDVLTKAIQNREDCREKTTTGQYRNRWSAESRYYSEDVFKAAARDLVLAIIDIHNNGWTKTIYDTGERENCQATMFYTFADRFEALRELLHCSKTTCQDILKGSRFHTIIGNPRTLTFRTATNRAANDHKAGLIKRGKESSKGKGIADVEGQSDSEEHPETPMTTKSSFSKKSSKTLKRHHEDVLQAEEKPGDNAHRPKVVAKKHRKA